MLFKNKNKEFLNEIEGTYICIYFSVSRCFEAARREHFRLQGRGDHLQGDDGRNRGHDVTLHRADGAEGRAAQEEV